MSFKGIGLFLIGLCSYLLIAVILSYIPVKEKPQEASKDRTIYIASNGVHLDMILPKASMDTDLLAGLKYEENQEYFAFGWGEKNFYINAPEWSDLTVPIFSKAFFVSSPSLIHLTRYSDLKEDWIEVAVTEEQFNNINEYILETFDLGANNEKKILAGKGYWDYDDFYEATGGYSAFKNSNSWVNKALKENELKACLWTPFDFGVMRNYR